MKICGIDEAGRGPVIGPLVIAGVSIDENKLETLKKLEPKDSKMLSKKRREELFDQIQAQNKTRTNANKKITNIYTNKNSKHIT